MHKDPSGERSREGQAPFGGLFGFLWSWGPLILWFCAIFYFSTDVLSAQHTSHFIEPMIRRVFPDASPGAVYAMHVAVRKCGHLSEYALLSLLAFRAVRGNRAERFQTSWAVLAVCIAVGYALVDEFHQTFVSSRTGNLHDVAIDATGAATAMIVLAWFHRSRRSKNTGAFADV